MGERTTVCIIAHVPQGTEKQFLQHVRDYDTTHPDCHFEMSVDTPNLSMGEMIEVLKVNPEIPFVEMFRRGRPPP